MLTMWPVLLGDLNGTASADDGPPNVHLTMQMARSGQSWHEVLLDSSGQQGMPADASEKFICDTGIGLPAAGKTSGAATSPMIRKIASIRSMKLRRAMFYHHMKAKPGEEPHLHIFAIAPTR